MERKGKRKKWNGLRREQILCNIYDGIDDIFIIDIPRKQNHFGP